MVPLHKIITGATQKSKPLTRNGLLLWQNCNCSQRQNMSGRYQPQDLSQNGFPTIEACCVGTLGPYFIKYLYVQEYFTWFLGLPRPHQSQLHAHYLNRVYLAHKFRALQFSSAFQIFRGRFWHIHFVFLCSL